MSQNINLNKYTEYKLVKDDLIEDKEPAYDFPKYTTQIINLAGQNSQATRPNVVGQMSDLIQECPYNTYEGWKQWYLERYPDAIDKATDKAYDGVKKLINAGALIDRDMVKEWVMDLVLTKTAKGLIFQEAIFQYIAKLENTNYRLATPNEESQGIDGFVGDKPYQIKPKSYLSKNALPEDIPVDIIFYDEGKNSKYLKIYYK